MKEFITPFILPFNAAIIAIVWVFALTDSGNIFDFWPRFVNNVVKNLPFRLKGKLIALAYGCEKCLAGQIALWWSIVVYGLDLHIVFFNVIYAIFIALLIGRILN